MMIMQTTVRKPMPVCRKFLEAVADRVYDVIIVTVRPGHWAVKRLMVTNKIVTRLQRLLTPSASTILPQHKNIMSSRATSVRPPYISIRARGLSSASPISVSKPSASGEGAAPLTPSSNSTLPEVSEHASMSPTFITSFTSYITSRPNKHMYSLPSSASSSSDSLSLPLPASPKQAAFGAEIWEEDGHFRVGGRPTNKETLHWWSGSVSVRPPFGSILF